jgi:hypothetical protein
MKSRGRAQVTLHFVYRNHTAGLRLTRSWSAAEARRTGEKRNPLKALYKPGSWSSFNP